MRIPALPASHLSYCSNIHPGESWPEVKASLQHYLPLVKERVCPEDEFGVGLRLSAQAAKELSSNESELFQFKQWLAENSLYVFTVNGFPYGTFHGEAIKEKVYLPDWSSQERLVYTKQLAKLLALLVPDDCYGSISTVPLGFSEYFSDRSRLDQAVKNLLAFVAYAWKLEKQNGKHIALALEPEPGCYLEDTQGTLNFFTHHLYQQTALRQLKELGLPKEMCTTSTIKRFLGVCVDTCHAAVMFESSLEMAKRLAAADISIPKIQLTTALKQNLQSQKTNRYLGAYAEANYLHQTCIQDVNNNIRFYLDLPEVIVDAFENENQQAELKELRSHFHVPVFIEEPGEIGTTQSELLEFLEALPRQNFSRHYELETYTFDVLPKNLIKTSVEDSISRELFWVMEVLS